MTTPRSREEIESDAEKIGWSQWTLPHAVPLIIEVLLDIRDLLTKKNPTDV